MVKKSDVQVGGTYLAKVGARQVEVRIERTIEKGGWDASSVASGKPIRIKNAARLVKRVTTDPEPEVTPAAPVEAKAPKPAKQTKATAKSEDSVKAPAAPKAMSLLDAAAQVLGEAKAPMTTGQIVEAVVAKGLWTPGTGKTPAATLYSAILREGKTKGDASRFTKADRGLFTRNPKNA